MEVKKAILNTESVGNFITILQFQRSFYNIDKVMDKIIQFYNFKDHFKYLLLIVYIVFVVMDPT